MNKLTLTNYRPTPVNCKFVENAFDWVKNFLNALKNAD